MNDRSDQPKSSGLGQMGLTTVDNFTYRHNGNRSANVGMLAGNCVSIRGISNVTKQAQLEAAGLIVLPGKWSQVRRANGDYTDWQ